MQTVFTDFQNLWSLNYTKILKKLATPPSPQTLELFQATWNIIRKLKFPRPLFPSRLEFWRFVEQVTTFLGLSRFSGKFFLHLKQNNKNKYNQPNKQTNNQNDYLNLILKLLSNSYTCSLLSTIFFKLSTKPSHFYLFKRPFFINVHVHASTSFSRTFASR